MVSASNSWEEGGLGTRPSHDLVKESMKAVSRINSDLEWKIKAIAALPNPPDLDISLCNAAKAAMEAEAKRFAEAEKAKHRSIIQLEELYQMYDSIVKKSENPEISIVESDIQGNMNLDLQQLVHELSRLILFNLPDSAQKLSTIAKLDLSNNNMKCLAESLTSLVNLRTLDLHSNQLTSLPHSMGRLEKLKILNISGNFFTELPESVQNCCRLEELIADFNELKWLPETLAIKLINLRKLSLRSNKLAYLPVSISSLIYLCVLDVHMNKLRRLPEDIGSLVSLEMLNVSCNFNYFNALPDSICGLISLVELDASYNQIKTLPDFTGCLVKLKRLNLEGNPLVRPPPKIVRDGRQAVKPHIRNRASQTDQPREFSSLGRKSGPGQIMTSGKALQPRKLSSLLGKSGPSRIATSGKRMTLYEHMYGEEGFSSCKLSSLARKSGTSEIMTAVKSMTLYEHIYGEDGFSSGSSCLMLSRSFFNTRRTPLLRNKI